MSVLFKTDIRNIEKIYSNKKAINTMSIASQNILHEENSTNYYILKPEFLSASLRCLHHILHNLMEDD